VSEIRVALLRLKVKGYINAYSRRVMNYYFSSTDYVPATTLRGAILELEYQTKGKVNDKFWVGPALPLGSAFSHFFIPLNEKARDGGKDSAEAQEMKGVLEEAGKVDKWDKESVYKLVREKGLLGHGRKPRIGAVIRKVGERDGYNLYERVRLNSVVQMQTAVDKLTGSNAREMLFAYEYKEFRDLWALSSPDLPQDRGVLRMGRGKSRSGFQVSFEKVRELDLELAKKGEVGYCLTPCAPSVMGVKLLDGDYLGDLSIYTGWFTNDHVTGTKPTFRVLREGTLVKVREAGNYQRLLGAGLNFLVKVNDLGELLEKVM
jgi:hypothetical protein